MNPAVRIREIESADWPAVWKILAPVFRAGETYTFPTNISEEDARSRWIDKPTATFVAADPDGEVLGTYFIKPNQEGNGSHVCNCGYVTSEAARGRGVATLMCEHSQEEAVRLGFRAMQFNFVVSSNEGAVRLWKKLGFETVGTLPRAFDHPANGLVDAFVMYKWLGS